MTVELDEERGAQVRCVYVPATAVILKIPQVRICRAVKHMCQS